MKRRFALATAVVTACIATSAFAQAPQGALIAASSSLAATSTSEEYLNPLHQEEWVTLNDHRGFSGSYRQLAENQSTGNKSVQLALMQNGRALHRVETDEKGKFHFTNVQVGTYALVARGEHTMAIFALHVLPSDASKRLDSDIAVFGTVAPAAAIDAILRSDVVPEVSTIYPTLDIDPIGDARQFNAESNVKLRGTDLVGRISRAAGLAHYDLTGNSVRILQDGKTIAQAITNAKGEFSIPKVEAGTYDLIVAGKDGVAVSSFHAVADEGVAVASASPKLVATTLQDCPSCLNIEVTSCNECWSESAPMMDPVTSVAGNVIDPGMAPIPGGGFVDPSGFVGGGGGFAGGGFGGGGFGGGGFGGGGLGGGGFAGGAGGLPLGALLGIGGLAAGVAALAANDDGFNAAPASIIVP